MTTATRLARAHEAAQAAFHDMLTEGAFPDPDHPLTRAYVAAERLVDSILVGAQWERAKTELDRLQAGDHFRYPDWEVRKVDMDAMQLADHVNHEEPVEGCGDCQENVAETWQSVMA